MFHYKPDNINPNGKQRVYFSCHPDDFDYCFQRISDSILKCVRCAIWYADPNEPYEDIETDLNQMNLFVIPITTKLLTKKNRTIDVDLPFAVQHHIPILPLMQEDGLIELYTEFFGDLQYLDENDIDDTALPYRVL